jgi:hypothetical protein
MGLGAERMSQRDLQQYKDTLTGFKGRRCYAGLHTNSIRLRFDDPEKQGHYVWVDPPWVFSSSLEVITTSDSYSEDTFKEWCQLFRAIRDTRLQDFEAGQNGEVTLVFLDGYRLFIPLDSASDNPDSDYDQWYAYDV